MVLGKLFNYMQKNKTRLLIYIYKQMNSKGIEDLNIRSEIIQSLEEYLGDNILNIASMIIFFNLTPKARKQIQK